MIYNTNVDLVNDNYFTKFGPFCQFVLQMLGKNQILTWIKDRNSVAKLAKIKGLHPVANLWKTMIYYTNVDLVNDNVYTKFGIILSIPSQDIEKNPNSDINQGPLLCCKFA